MEIYISWYVLNSASYTHLKNLYQVNGAPLETHKYIIKRFSVLNAKIQNNTVTLKADGSRAEDFRSTFKILYAS